MISGDYYFIISLARKKCICYKL